MATKFAAFNGIKIWAVAEYRDEAQKAAVVAGARPESLQVTSMTPAAAALFATGVEDVGAYQDMRDGKLGTKAEFFPDPAA